jgi:sec-independent protein translocase protein TatA
LVDFNAPPADLCDMFGLGATELLIILVIVILIFGATRLPQIGRGLGEGIKNFRGALKEPTAIDVTPKDSDPAKSDAKRDA